MGIFFFESSNGVSYGSSFSQGDVIGILIDLDNDKLEFRKNGVSFGVAPRKPSDLGGRYIFTQLMVDFIAVL